MKFINILLKKLLLHIGGEKMEFYLQENGMKTNFDYGELDISGDETYGFRPFQLMVASIVGCSGSVFRKILDKQRIKIEDLTIKADVTRIEEEANRIEKITLTYTIEGHDLNVEKLNKNLELARKNCPMVRSVETSINIEEQLKVIELNN